MLVVVVLLKVVLVGLMLDEDEGAVEGLVPGSPVGAPPPPPDVSPVPLDPDGPQAELEVRFSLLDMQVKVSLRLWPNATTARITPTVTSMDMPMT